MKYSERGEKIYFSQLIESDPWFDLPYWDGNVRHHGCGLISLTLCIDLLTGRDYTPKDVYDIRREYGLDQLHIADKEGRSVCGGDVTIRLNEANRAMFGIESRVMERTADAFREVLEKENSVIWASSRNCDFLNMRGDRWFKPRGHAIVFWRYEDGIFYAKDCAYFYENGRDIPYTEADLTQWLQGHDRQHFEITLAE